MDFSKIVLSQGEYIKNIDVGYYTTFVLTNKGKLYGIGSNMNNRLGLPNAETNLTEFTLLRSDVKEFYSYKGYENEQEVSVYFITNDNKLYIGGSYYMNDVYPLDTYGNYNLTEYTYITNNVKFADFYGGSLMYIDLNDVCWALGYNDNYRFGRSGNLTSFTQIATNVKQCSCHQYDTSTYITNNGDMYVSGYMAGFLLGTSNTSALTSYTLARSNVKSLESMNYYIGNDNSLYYTIIGTSGSGIDQSWVKVLDNVKLTTRADYDAYIAVTYDNKAYRINSNNNDTNKRYIANGLGVNDNSGDPVLFRENIKKAYSWNAYDDIFVIDTNNKLWGIVGENATTFSLMMEDTGFANEGYIPSGLSEDCLLGFLKFESL